MQRSKEVGVGRSIDGYTIVKKDTLGYIEVQRVNLSPLFKFNSIIENFKKIINIIRILLK